MFRSLPLILLACVIEVAAVAGLTALAWVARPALAGLFPGLALTDAGIAITGAVLYGVSWLISSFQSSPTFAVGGGVVAPMIVLMGLHAIAWFGGVEFPQRFVEIGYATICLSLAVVCFAIGTWYYLRRIEP